MINNLDNLSHNLARFRAFVRLAIQAKKLHIYLDVLFNSTSHLKKHYYPNSVLFSSIITRITEATTELQYVDFCFDIRSEELNFAGLRRIDYTPYIKTEPQSTLISMENTNNPLINPECSSCHQQAKSLENFCSQKKYLEDTVNQLNKKLMDFKLHDSQLTHRNQVLQAAFDQLQMKFVLLHEEYLQELRRFGIYSHLGCGSARVSSADDFQLKYSNAAVARNFSVGNEITEDTDIVDLLSAEQQPEQVAIGQELTDSLTFSPSPSRCQTAAFRGSTPITTGPSAARSPPQPSTAPTHRSHLMLDLVDLNDCTEVSEQTFSEYLQKFRLPDCEDPSPTEGELPLNVESWMIDMKPGQTNFRCRYALPKICSRKTSTPRPCLDLFSELQQTDSSFLFPCPGSPPSSMSEATSDQVSDIAFDVPPTSESGVTTSTVTIKAAEEEENGHNPRARSDDDNWKDYYELTSTSEKGLESENCRTDSENMKTKRRDTPANMLLH